MIRRRARELALQILFQKEFGAQDEVDKFVAAAKNNFPAAKEVWTYAETLIRGVLTHLKDIDAVIESSSHHWRLDRMAYVDKNILRIATLELKHMSEVPPKVAIDEAVEMAKKFGTADSKGFINGILDQIAKG